MKISAKGAYAIRAMLDLALFAQDNPVQVKEIAKRQHIPYRFLEQVMSSLRKSDLVESTRGAQGGYYLKRNASQIHLAEIIAALEGPLSLLACISDHEGQICDLENDCLLQEVWRGLNTAIEEVLGSITLKDIVDKQRAHEASIPIVHI